jgi:hypothetical protein
MFSAKVLAILAIVQRQFTAAEEVDYAQFVNPFIGTEGAIPGYACMSPDYFSLASY